MFFSISLREIKKVLLNRDKAFNFFFACNTEVWQIFGLSLAKMIVFIYHYLIFNLYSNVFIF